MNKQLKNTSCFDRSKLQQKQNLRENVKELFNTLKEQRRIKKIKKKEEEKRKKKKKKKKKKKI